jgi:hypothetical protein
MKIFVIQEIQEIQIKKILQSLLCQIAEKDNLKKCKTRKTKAGFKVHCPKSVRSVIKLGKLQSMYRETKVVIFMILGGS